MNWQSSGPLCRGQRRDAADGPTGSETIDRDLTYDLKNLVQTSGATSQIRQCVYANTMLLFVFR